MFVRRNRAITYLKAGRTQQEQERYLDGTSRERDGVVVDRRDGRYERKTRKGNKGEMVRVLQARGMGKKMRVVAGNTRVNKTGSEQ
jgi:RecA/RadA recombinase